METLNALVRRAQLGDTRAYNAIVIRFQDMAFAYAYSFLKDFHLAQDVAQEAFVGAFYDLPNLRAPEAFASWFRRVVYKQCDRVTRGKSYDTISLDDVVLRSPDKDPMAQLESQEMKTYVLNAIQVLPEEERQVVTLFYMSDYTHTEIAAFLDMSETTVNNRLRAARKRLKKGLLDMTKDTLKNEAPSRDPQFSDRVAKALNVVGLCEAAQSGDLAVVKQVVEANPKLMQAQIPNCRAEICHFEPFIWRRKKDMQMWWPFYWIMGDLLRKHGA
jgi:RNA polymerase sigma factor (sigma-70 family)